MQFALILRTSYAYAKLAGVCGYAAEGLELARTWGTEI